MSPFKNRQARLQLFNMWIILIGLIYLLGMNQTHARKTSCETSSNAVVGQAAHVMCHFPENLFTHRHWFQILRYDFDGQQFIPDLILKCSWRPFETTPKCATAHGFKVESVYHRYAEVRASNVTKQQAGVYRCQYTMSAPGTVEDCHLHVRDNRIGCDNVTVNQGEKARLKCHFNSDLKVTKDNFGILFTSLDTGKQVTLLDCSWPPFESPPVCAVYNNMYRLQKDTISRDAEVLVSVALPQHSGTYTCNTLPARPGVVVDACHVHVHKRETSCTGDTVYEGDTASVICHLNKHMTQTRGSFVLQHEPVGHLYYVDVVICMWVDSFSKHFCKTKLDGLMFDESKLESDVTFTIQSAKHHHAGRYRCDPIYGVPGITFHTCSILVRENTIVLTTATDRTKTELQGFSNMINTLETHTEPATPSGCTLDKDFTHYLVIVTLLYLLHRHG